MKISTDTTLMFYQNGKLMTVRGDRSTRTAFRAGHQPLAETSTDIQCHPLLLFTDGKGSALTTKISQQSESHAYSPYGHPSPPSRTLTNFNGENLELHTQCYLLGNGYRAFSPSLMRFISPDSWSTFGAGGINVYMYCAGDPVNYTDSSGHIKFWSTRRNKSNGYIIPALVDAAKTHQSISRALVSPNFAPPTYTQAKLMSWGKQMDYNYYVFVDDTRRISKIKLMYNPIHDSEPPTYATRPIADQRTLNLTLSRTDTLLPLEEPEYKAQLKSLTAAANRAGIDGYGRPLSGRSLDIRQDSLLHELRLKALALDYRRTKTIFYFHGWSGMRSN